jgi:NAD(P)-dependent dehydrogenase (short-subunit alcohol dehydrogenase family)
VIADLALRPEAQKLVDEYTSQPRVVFVKTDVVMWDQLTNMFDVAEKEFGGADIVCFQPSFRTWHATFSINILKNNVNRFAPELASSNRTGQTSGTHPELQSPKMTLMAPTESAIMLAWTSTWSIPSERHSWRSPAG